MKKLELPLTLSNSCIANWYIFQVKNLPSFEDIYLDEDARFYAEIRYNKMSLGFAEFYFSKSPINQFLVSKPLES